MSAGLAFLPMIISAVSTGFQMFSAYQEGQQQAALAEYNAEVMEQQARQEEEAAKLEAYRMQKEKDRFLATQRAAYSASGFTLEGSPMEVMANTAGQFEYDIALNTYGRQLKAWQARSQAGLFKYQAGAAKRAGTMGMIGAGLSGAVSLSTIGALKETGGTNNMLNSSLTNKWKTPLMKELGF